MRGRYRRVQDGREIDPEGGGKQCAQHEIAEFGDPDISAGRNDPLGDGLHHISAGKQRPRALADSSDQDCAENSQHPAADSRPHIVRNIVGADIERHIAPDNRGDHNDQPVFAKGVLGARNVQTDQGQKDDGQSQRDGYALEIEKLGLEKAEPAKVINVAVFDFFGIRRH